MRRVVSTPQLFCMPICLDQQLWSTIIIVSLQARYTKCIYYAPQKSFAARAGSSQPNGGDRIMAVFTNSNHASNAAVCGLKINWAVVKIVNPALKAQYPLKDFIVKQVVGIDTSELLAARIDVRGGNDLVWIGRAATHSAKLAEYRNDVQTWITEQTYGALADWAKLGGNPPVDMWSRYSWSGMNDIPVYGSTWWWSLE